MTVLGHPRQKVSETSSQPVKCWAQWHMSAIAAKAGRVKRIKL
jgi:hypothetical protein